MPCGCGLESTGASSCGNARRRLLAVFALAAVAAAVPLSSAQAAARGVRVGIVIDGPVTRADLIDTF
ncbi:MAG: hypothetical protein AAEJ52_09580, partial [Myxococcota bacterium]